MRNEIRECPCGSGLPRDELYDARGIFRGYLCSQCEQEKRMKHLPEVFEDPNYKSDEIISLHKSDD